MNAAVIIIDIILILIAIVLIVIVLMQEGQSQGLGAIGGGAETFFGKNKAKSLEGKLARYTKIAAVVFIVLAIATTIIVSHQESDTIDVSNMTEEELMEAVQGEIEAAEEAAAAEGEEIVEEAGEEPVEETGEEAAEEATEGAGDAE